MVIERLGETIANTEVKTLSERKAKRTETFVYSSRHCLQAASLFEALAHSLAEVKS